eukprot:CAMPEP_0178376590 /NCGR_PEP_ID=MMETSP0689_2-20121128/3481_1 /TAXON_ID=160604 /ORGANISM="Amphidinium massartii, Strain CS-259" /LENGTH=561 /DNA_ID=CAMNT_0019996617 /DNA_START=61 /DNA_END=1743 /DNA_ORIENTATION=+
MVDVDVQVSGISCRPAAEWPEGLREGVAKLRDLVRNDVDFQRHAAFGVLQSKDLARFLLARQGDVDRAAQMLRQALSWRNRRMPYWLLLDPASDVSQAFRTECRTGKVYTVAGCDRYGRGMCVMDNSVQNTVDLDAQLRYLAYCIEAARSNCSPGVDKITVVVNLEAFSMRNTIPMRAVQETIEMLTIVHPETLGSCILWQVPQIFSAFFKLCKQLLDARTLMKIIAINGDVSEGSPNDDTLVDVIGENWRELTGLTTPRMERAYSEYFQRHIVGARGFNFHAHWQGMLLRDAQRAEASGTPPWPLKWADMMSATWDGAYRGFWETNLEAPPDSEQVSAVSDGGSDEGWATPPMSEAEMGALSPPASSVVTAAASGVPPALSPALSMLGKPVRVRSRQLVAQLDLLSYPASTSFPISGVWFVGLTSLAISCARVIIVFVAMCQRDDRKHRPILLREPPQVPLALWVFTLLDIPLVSLGVGLLSFVESLPRGCEGSRFLSCIPWGLMICSCLTLPEAVMGGLRTQRVDRVEAGFGNSQFEAILAPLLLLIDAVLCILFAIVW